MWLLCGKGYFPHTSPHLLVSRDLEEGDGCVSIFSAIDNLSAGWSLDGNIFSFFKDDKSVWCNPSARQRAGDGLFTQTFAVWRVGKDKPTRLDPFGRPKICGITLKKLGLAADAEMLDVSANEAARLNAGVDEDTVSSAPR